MSKAQQNLIDSTILVEYVSAAIIPCKAPKSFVKGQLSIKAGQRFFLIRSDREDTRFYVVGWNEERLSWQCSCGAGCKAHSHVKNANEYVKVQVAKQKQAETVSAREKALAEARTAANDLLARIDQEVQATIEAEIAAEPAELSEQARIADLDNFHYWQAELANEKDESNEEARISAMTDQALMEHAVLNGNRRDGVLMPTPLTQTPTPRKVSMAWLCNR